jgi:hypothetical protein
MITDISELHPHPPGTENLLVDSLLQMKGRKNDRGKRSPVSSVFDHICRTVPAQLARLCFELSAPTFCTHVFNSDVCAPDVIWNTRLRQDLVVHLYDSLKEWHRNSFSYEIKSVDVVGGTPSRFQAILNEPQQSGLNLRALLNCTSVKEFVGPVESSSIVKDFIRALHSSLSAIRRGSATPSQLSLAARQVSAEARKQAFTSSYVPSSSVSGPNDAFLDFPPPTQSCILLLAISNLFELLTFPEDIWFDDALPTICNALESLHRLANEQGNTTLLPLEASAACILTLLRSLFAAGFSQDNSIRQSQVKSFTKSLRDFRGDARRADNPIQLLKVTHSSVSSMLRLCLKLSTEETVLLALQRWRCAVDVLFTSSTAFLLVVAVQCANISSSDGKSPMQKTSNAMESGESSERATKRPSIVEPIKSPIGLDAPFTSEVSLCLRLLSDHGYFLDFVRCTLPCYLNAAPVAILHVLTALRFFNSAVRDCPSMQSHSLLDELIRHGLPITLLNILCTTLTDDMAPFTTKDRSWISHPMIDSPDTFIERVPPPLNRRRSSVTAADELPTLIELPSQSGLVETDIATVCKALIQKNKRNLTQFAFSNSSDSEFPGQQAPTSTHSPQRQLVYEVVLLLRSMIRTAIGSEDVSRKQGSPSGTAQQSKQRHPLLEFMDQVLTPSLVHLMLNHSSLFLEVFRATKATKRPLAIWNSVLLTTLKDFLKRELDRMNEEGAESPIIFQISAALEKESFRGFHPSLVDEIVVDGVYVNLLLDPQHRDDIGARNLPAFVEELQASVSSSKRVLELVQLRRQSASRQSIMSHVSIKQQVLNHIIRDHPELGYSDLYVVDDQNVG